MLPISRFVRSSAPLLLLPLLAACGSGSGREANAAPAEGTEAAAAPQIPTGRFAGQVTETMNSGSYTYVKLERNGESVWAAGPETEVAVGDEFQVELSMPMHDFTSTTLDRKFDVLYFVTGFVPPAEAAATPAADPHAGVFDKAPGSGKPGDPHAGIPGWGEDEDAPALVVVEKAQDGYRIEEIWSGREELVGKDVAVRGTVVKSNPRILGVNWIHIQDGSGDAAAGTHDLTVTSDGTAAVGDVVTVRGRLVADKDFGAGYKYELLVEKAEIEVD